MQIVFAIGATCLTVAWIRANRRHLAPVWPAVMFSGLAAAPGLALLAELAGRVVIGRFGLHLSRSPLGVSPVTLVCGLWIFLGPVLLFISNGPALPDGRLPKGLRLVQASHVALWLASSTLAYTFIAAV